MGQYISRRQCEQCVSEGKVSGKIDSYMHIENCKCLDRCRKIVYFCSEGHRWIEDQNREQHYWSRMALGRAELTAYINERMPFWLEINSKK